MRYTRFVVALVAALLLASATTLEAQEKKATFVIDRVPENTLSFFYERLKDEFPFCAYGTIEKGAPHITHVAFPIIYVAISEYYERGGCHSEGLLGYGHSHPPPWGCSLSLTDIETFLYEDEPYIFLICPGKKRFYWWSRPVVERKLIAMTKAPPADKK